MATLNRVLTKWYLNLFSELKYCILMITNISDDLIKICSIRLAMLQIPVREFDIGWNVSVLYLLYSVNFIQKHVKSVREYGVTCA